MSFSNPHGWIDIEAELDENADHSDDDIREVYMRAVLRWNLPIDAGLLSAMRRFFAPEFLAKYPQTQGVSA